MPVIKTDITEFVKLSREFPVLDVRSPGEYERAHIPGAFSFPIFDNEERKEIGTAYKQVNRESAIKIGLAHFGKKLLAFVEKADALLQQKETRSKVVAVHCWRGGMRSSAMAWLLDLYGYKVYLLTGGYKAYRNWALKQFECSFRLHIVSGFTGSNKTGVLEALKQKGESVIDLEAIAKHRGSAFGHIGLPPQPTQEQFENLLAMELYALQQQNPEAKIWIEDESQRIGLVNIPPAFFAQMRQQEILFLSIPFEERLNFLASTYGVFEKQELLDGIARIQKKLGGPEYREACELLETGNVHACFRILLNYYDRLYLKSSLKRLNAESKILSVPAKSSNAHINADIVFNYVNTRTGV
jgi:tRNA 2-selenouridine synthase